MADQPSATLTATAPTPLNGGHPAETFSDLDAYVAIPRINGLVLSPDGERLVCAVQTLAPDRTSYRTALWEIDPQGGRPPRQLTRSATGESAPAFLPDGDLLFVSKRPDPDKGATRPGAEKAESGNASSENADAAAAAAAAVVSSSEDEVAALWLLPSRGGEARRLAAPAGGVSGVYTARESARAFATAALLPGAAGGDDKRRKARKDAGVSAILHESAPVRHWDHDLGPDELRLFAVEPAAPTDAGADAGADPEPEVSFRLRDLTPNPSRGLDEAGLAVSPDGSFVVAGWRVGGQRGREGRSLVAIDTATGERRVLAESGHTGDRHNYDAPAISPDGRYVVCVDERDGDYERCPTVTLRLVDLATGEGRDLLPGFPLWPASPVFAPGSGAVFFVADELGHCPVFRVDLATGDVVRLTASGAYTDLNPAPDGRSVYALRADIERPPAPVRLDVDAADQQPVELRAPGRVAAVPGRVEEVRATAPDGAALRAWLVLPDTASPESPAPFALWVHGGPLMSWHAWSWRWNPWLMAARGWAVLLPDPALSQGYGDDFVQRGWGNWGPVPFADLMALTDATLQRPDVDSSRTAAMGGSYGGYMANWIAGHTDRFRAIVTHASLWTLDHFTGATDHPYYWEQEWGHPLERPERYELNSPHRYLADIRTPMLVVHGDKDYRVPIGEGLRLWSDLVRQGVEAKFLYFPDENHWVLKPGNAKVWYQTVFAFLEHHVLGAEWARPELV